MLVDSSGHTATVMDAESLIALFRPTCLNIQMMPGGNLSQSLSNPFFLLFCNRQQLEHVQLLIPHYKTEKTTVNVWSKLPGHIVKSFEMLFYGVFVGQQHRVVSPNDFLFADMSRQFFQGLDTLVNAGHVGLYVLSIGCYGVVEVAVEAVGDLMQSWQNRTVVLATELHHIDGFRRELNSVHYIMVERITA